MTEAVRTAIVDMLETVPAIGRVHGFERYSKTHDQLAGLYAVDGAVRGWHVQRLAARRRLLDSGRTLATTTWAIVGFVSLVDADASEIAADVLIDGIIAAERADPTLGGVARGRPVEGVSGIQLIDAGPVMFAGALCHRARLSLAVETYEPAIDGDLAEVEGAPGRLVGLVVERLSELDGFDSIEGRLAWDPDDDAGGSPAAIVIPLGDQARGDPTTVDLDARIDLRIGVTIVGDARFQAGTGGALVAGGLEALVEAVRTSLHGWQPAAVEVPFTYVGAQPVEAPAGSIAWRLTFQPSVYIEDKSDGQD